MTLTLNRGIGFLFAAVSLCLLGTCGCNNKSEDKETKPAAAVAQTRPQKTVAAQPASRQTDPNLVPFEKAVIIEPAPQDHPQPPDMTHTGKSTAKIFETIKNGLWDSIVFTTAADKRIRYHAVINTELGDIHIDLFDDAAPNHVRNFVCLAKTGYFDGMSFYKSLNNMIEDEMAAYIETGCPLGKGDRYSGSIGYWLKPEISDKVTPEEGSLVAYADPEDPNTAACRFYITAIRTSLDGTIFGRVTKGLDIVRTINKRKVENDDRLKEPVLIRTVTIQTTQE